MPLRIREQKEAEESVKLPDSIDHLSFSSVDTYLACPMQWYFRYVEGVKRPPNIFLKFGGCGHEALKFNNMNKWETGNDLPANIVTDKFADEFSVQRKTIEDWDGEDPDKSYDKHQKIGAGFMGDYMEHVAPTFKPASQPEAKGELKIGNIPLIYYIDLETDKTIVDYKFVGSKKSERDVKNSLQMWLYSIARKKEDTSMMFFNKKNGDIYDEVATIDDTDRTHARRIVLTTARAITSGAFFPRKPDGQEAWRCTPKFCGYYHMCRGGSRRML
jgi:hypothetical protein